MDGVGGADSRANRYKYLCNIKGYHVLKGDIRAPLGKRALGIKLGRVQLGTVQPPADRRNA